MGKSKLDNFLIGRPGSKSANVIHVVDFGIARAEYRETKTKAGTIKGKFAYMSPEQARGDELDARCDVYAAGIMLYEILTGAPPFTGATPLNVLTAHLTSDLEPPSKRATNGRGGEGMGGRAARRGAPRYPAGHPAAEHRHAAGPAAPLGLHPAAPGRPGPAR